MDRLLPTLFFIVHLWLCTFSFTPNPHRTFSTLFRSLFRLQHRDRWSVSVALAEAAWIKVKWTRTDVNQEWWQEIERWKCYPFRCAQVTHALRSPVLTLRNTFGGHISSGVPANISQIRWILFPISILQRAHRKCLERKGHFAVSEPIRFSYSKWNWWETAWCFLLVSCQSGRTQKHPFSARKAAASCFSHN